jgi:preprotein translocase subunit SecE
VIEEAKQGVAGTADTAKLVAAIALVIAGIVVFYAFGEAPAWQRWLAVAGGVVVAAAVLGWSQYGRSLRQFALDSRVELRKIVWPSRQETGTTTLVVFVFVVISGVFFWLLDLVLAWATRALTGQGG